MSYTIDYYIDPDSPTDGAGTLSDATAGVANCQPIIVGVPANATHYALGHGLGGAAQVVMVTQGI